jgi:hypothetical protein
MDEITDLRALGLLERNAASGEIFVFPALIELQTPKSQRFWGEIGLLNGGNYRIVICLNCRHIKCIPLSKKNTNFKIPCVPEGVSSGRVWQNKKAIMLENTP